jgi:hypothetical protein
MKARTERSNERAAIKLERADKIHPKGRSKYALTKKGQYKPKQDPNRRPSWFVRTGLAALAEVTALRNAAWEARQHHRPTDTQMEDRNAERA